MAQTIKLRRGPVGNLASVSAAQGELLLATGSVSDLSGPFLTMTGTGGTGTSVLVGRIYEGTTAPSIGSNTSLTGTPFYATGNNTLYRLNTAGNEALDLSGNLENTVISNITVSGSFSGSFQGDGSSLSGVASDLDIAGDTGTGTVSLLSETFTIAGGGGADTVVSGETVTISVNSGSLLPYYSSSIFNTITGDVLFSAEGLATIQENSVALGTDTTGNYVGTITAGTGISSSGATTGEGIDHTLSVLYGSTIGTAVRGDTTIAINGTINEVEVTGGSQALGSSPSYTVGLPTNVVVAGQITAATGSITGDLTVGGNLYVQGTSTIVDSTTVQIGDNIIELNGAGGVNGGIKVNDVSAPDTTSGSLLWDTANDYWMAGPEGSEKEIALFSAAPTPDSLQRVDANGQLTDSTISDDGTDITLTGELTVQGLAASSFIVTNGSSQLLEVTPSTTGDLVQWNGAAFVASNTIDGGTF